MLQQRSNGNDEEPAKETQQRQIHRHVGEGQSVPSEECGKHRQADRTQRDEAVFDFAAGQITRRKTAQADSDGRRRLEITGLLRIVDVKHVRGVTDDEQLNQRRECEEVSIAQVGEPKDAILADELNLPPQVRNQIGAELFRRIGGGNFGNAQAREESEDCQRDQ